MAGRGRRARGLEKGCVPPPALLPPRPALQGAVRGQSSRSIHTTRLLWREAALPGSAGRSWGDFLGEASSHVAPAPSVLPPAGASEEELCPKHDIPSGLQRCGTKLTVTGEGLVTNPPSLGTDASTERGAARRGLQSSGAGDAGARPAPRGSAGAGGSHVLSLPLLRATPPAPVYGLQQGAEPWFCTACSQPLPTLPLSYSCIPPPARASLVRGSDSLRAPHLPPRGFSLHLPDVCGRQVGMGWLPCPQQGWREKLTQQDPKTVAPHPCSPPADTSSTLWVPVQPELRV